MATLTADRRSGKIVGFNIQWYENARRQTIYLGSRKFRWQTAERFKEVIETLVYCRYNEGIVPNKVTQHWLANAPVELQHKLAKVGLFAITKPQTCQELWEAYLKQKTGIKPATLDAYRDTRAKFFEVFSTDELIVKITPDRLLKWRDAMLEKYAPASVTGYLKNLKAVFAWAIRQDWLPKNPAVGISGGGYINRNNDRVITMAEYALLLEACSNQEWRTILALARIGGLRCPSELIQLRWSDIQWANNRFLVRSPKTERHAKCSERLVPLFPELRKELERHFALVEKNNHEFVIVHYQGKSWQLGSPFSRIAKRTDLGVIVRPFDNMRMSRSNEVLRRWGEVKESLWIGHSTKIMKDHYLLMSDEDFSEAAEK